MDAVAVAVDVLGDLPIGGEWRGEHQRDVVAPHDVRGAVADAGLQSRVGDGREAPERAVVGDRLASVADPELDVVDALERQEVLRLSEGILVDVGAGLVRGAAGDRLGHRLDSSRHESRPDADEAAAGTLSWPPSSPVMEVRPSWKIERSVGLRPPYVVGRRPAERQRGRRRWIAISSRRHATGTGRHTPT